MRLGRPKAKNRIAAMRLPGAMRLPPPSWQSSTHSICGKETKTNVRTRMAHGAGQPHSGKTQY